MWTLLSCTATHEAATGLESKKQNNYGQMVRRLQKNVPLLISLVMKKLSSIKDGIC